MIKVNPVTIKPSNLVHRDLPKPVQKPKTDKPKNDKPKGEMAESKKKKVEEKKKVVKPEDDSEDPSKYPENRRKWLQS